MLPRLGLNNSQIAREVGSLDAARIRSRFWRNPSWLGPTLGQPFWKT